MWKRVCKKIFATTCVASFALAVVFTAVRAMMGQPGIAENWLLVDLAFALAMGLSLIAISIGLFFVRSAKWARIQTIAALFLLVGQSLYSIGYAAPHWLSWATGRECVTVGHGPIAPAGHIQGAQARRLDAHMEELCQKGFACVVLVAKGDTVELCKGYGYADKARKIPFDQETVFTVGSITKQFTAAGILKLEMQGKLSVDDPITRFFDSVPEEKQAITLHHLLTHISGLRGGFGGDFESMSRDQIVSAILTSELHAEPGQMHAYSNAGYSLLGAITEIVSSQPYEEFLHDYLFKPAGMHQTGYRIPKWPEEKMAHGYTLTNVDWGTLLDQPWAEDGPWWNLRANGGILSTVGDLLKWHRALQGEAILSAEAKAKLFHPHVKEEPGSSSSYGYGWKIDETARGTKVIKHSGGNAIFYADFRRYVDEDVLFLIATNQTVHMGYFRESGILEALFGETD